MLKIRLQRVGRKHEPVFRIVLTESQNGPKSNNHIAILGSYDPRDKNITKVDGDAVKEWIGKGAQVSDTVHNILVNEGVIDGKKKNVLPKGTPIVKEVEESDEVPAEEGDDEAPTTEDAPVEESAPEEAPAEEVKEEAPVEEEKPAEEETPTEEPKEEEKTEE